MEEYCNGYIVYIPEDRDGIYFEIKSDDGVIHHSDGPYESEEIAIAYGKHFIRYSGEL